MATDNKGNMKTDGIQATTEAEDSSVQRMLDRALAAQARFKKAPDVFIQEQTDDLMKRLRRRYVPESIGKRPSKHVYFGLASRMDETVDQGYAPVLNEKRQPVRLNELVMYWMPIEMHNKRVKASQDEATANLNKAMSKGGRQSSAASFKGSENADVPAPDRTAVEVEELEIKTGGNG